MNYNKNGKTTELPSQRKPISVSVCTYRVQGISFQSFSKQFCNYLIFKAENFEEEAKSEL